jgi:hypothetical protein
VYDEKQSKARQSVEVHGVNQQETLNNTRVFYIAFPTRTSVVPIPMLVPTNPYISSVRACVRSFVLQILLLPPGPRVLVQMPLDVAFFVVQRAGADLE